MFGGNERDRGRKIWELAHDNNKKKKVITRRVVKKVPVILN